MEISQHFNVSFDHIWMDQIDVAMDRLSCHSMMVHSVVNLITCVILHLLDNILQDVFSDSLVPFCLLKMILCFFLSLVKEGKIWSRSMNDSLQNRPDVVELNSVHVTVDSLRLVHLEPVRFLCLVFVMFLDLIGVFDV